MKSIWSRAALSFTVLFGFTAYAWSQHHDHAEPTGRPPEKLGKVNFPTSCDPKVQPLFERGVALLHSFWFQEGSKTFNAVLQQDPDCAIAYWGIGVNRLLNPFGGQPGPKFYQEGAAAVAKGKAMAAKTQRERDYIDAIAVLYDDSANKTWREKLVAYENAMAELVKRYPDDKEAAVFYSVALNIAHDFNDKTYAKPLKAAGILEALFKQMPDHPGVTHFLIHSYDFPPLADKGLAAARRYADIAPSAAHALHMPSHIFTRVGAWEDSAATNRRSEIEAQRGAGVDEALHALDYQIYAYLQLGRDGDAAQVLKRALAQAERVSDRPSGVFGLAAVQARYAVERGDWKAAAELSPRRTSVPFADAVTHFARAIGAARAGNPSVAQADVQKLAELRDALKAKKNDYFAEQVEIQRLGAAAWVALAEGKRDEALSLMRESAELENRSEKSPISPGPILPARELLGEMLIELKQFPAALKEFETSQQREPNRFRGYYGAARAAEGAGDKTKAAEYYKKLLALAAKADGDRKELMHARTVMKSSSAPARTSSAY
jgi:tetratricopeptide (TPR) repeat protein